ncbi:putative ribonuclease H-like domain-containing protein [Tanacetum coccineum]
MTKTSNEQGFISAVYEGKTHEDLHTWFEDLEFPDRVYKVEKALYSLHQAPRAWYETLSTYLLDNGFQRGQIDKTVFIKRVKGDILLVQVYVDGIIFRSTRNEMCNKFEKMMHKKFQMSSMGELTFFLGLQVTQKDDGIFISQDKYVDEILKKFGFSTIKTASTPMETSKPLLKDAEAEDVDVHLYRSMIGSLMYLTASRPDIMFAVCACARFQVTPKVSHLHAVKRIFKYMKVQPKFGLWYPKDSPFDLEAYTDSDYIVIQMREAYSDMIGFTRIHNVAEFTLIKAIDVGSEMEKAACRVDETVIKEWKDKMERAATTASGLEAEQDSVVPGAKIPHWGGAEAQIRFEDASKQSNDPYLSRVNTLGCGEDNMKLKELMDLCIELPEKVLDLG